MLPEGLEWIPRYQHAKDELALTLDGRVVAQLMQRVDGTWLALLWAHRGISAPLVTRDCRSFQTGKAGIETWACRHAEQLRREMLHQSTDVSTARPAFRGNGPVRPLAG